MKDKRAVFRHHTLIYLCPVTATLLFSLICSLYRQPSQLSLLATATEIPDALAQESVTPNQKAEADRLFQRGIEQFRRSQFREALETYQQVLRLRREVNDRLGEGEALYNIGVIYRYLSQYSQGREFLEQALELAKSIDNRPLLGHILKDIGVIYSSLSQYSKALEFYQQALAISREIGDRTIEAHTLDHLGVVYRRQGKYYQALEFHQQALTMSREIGDWAVQGRILNNIGVAYDNLGQYSQALNFDQQALGISREVGDRFIEARILESIGVVYDNQGQYSQALEFYQQALFIRREIGDQAGEGSTINNIGAVYDSQGKYAQALESYQQALVIRRGIGDRSGEGITLGNIGLVYWNLGQYAHALEFYQQALIVSQEIGDRPGEGYTLSSMGGVYQSQGQYSQALKFYQQALGIRQEIGDKAGEGYTLNNLGGIHYSLGQYAEALEFYQQALTIRRQIGDQAGEGTTLNNIGLVYDLQEQTSQALEFYQKALAIHQGIGDKAGEGNTLNNIGLIYGSLGQYSQALEIFQQSLTIRRQIGDKAGEGTTLNNIGLVYKNLGQYLQTLESYQRALDIFKEIGNRPGERVALSNIGSLLEQQNQIELAIVFYKQSVNLTEMVRKDLRILSQEQQQSYTETVADIYRHLADLLLQQNRIIEAQRVLDLLKLQELDDYLGNVRGNEQTSQGIDLLSLEQQLWQGIDIFLNPNEQQGIIKPLDEFIKRSDVVVLVQQLRQKAREQRLDLSYLDILQDSLRQLDQNAVLLYPLILEDRLELVLVTPNSPPIHRTVPVRREDLNRAIVEFLDSLTIPRKRLTIKAARESGHQLYDWLIKPIENDLAQAKAQTIIYAPDDQLRYIPLAALFDGNQWLVERFSVNNITAASLIDFNPQPPVQPRVLAAAFSQGRYEFQLGTREFVFSGLQFAGREVENIAAEIPGTTKLLDRAFSRDATIPQLNDHNIVHLATHGAFVPGQPEESFILFGNGDRATLRDVESWNLKNVDLVVLSACQTGVSGQLGNGEEILGLGYQMQQAGALATIASLWVVDDQGTQVLMDAFYGALQQRNAKADALRQAQIALINSDYKHPYYWAPFILIGNGL